MGKISGFMDYGREDMSKDPVPQRIQNYKEFEKPLHDPRVETQAARCMDCGVPYCSWGCPVDNLIPEFNDFVYRGQWEQAYKTLATTNNFPEFTGRVCPAPCEPACCATIVESPITIKHIELAIIEKAFKNGWVKPRRISGRTGVKIAVVGSGPAGLAAAQQLNLYGHTVTDRFGGLLTYGIPDFKLEKWVVERRLDIMRQEEIQFVNNTAIGTDYPVDKLKQDFDYIALCCGAQEHRDLEIEDVPKRNKRNFGEHFNPESLIDAADKHVIVIGGGDTGSDCVGTAVRQKAKSVTQIQLHKTPPEDHGNNPAWPYMPKVLKKFSFS
ncbi:hypothetical protein CHS0354_002005 [Potamilus streckersoni]|uniref:4Fe-4S ferredoxin-type domain-containing protein n=1 Tax=Potamilus streckersoni TaxID=2493646 RepID=A0AAE0T5H9_9BIVA|nr:hypothetical protein CHS0354_002005 [Potamilus streckersoni]